MEFEQWFSKGKQEVFYEYLDRIQENPTYTEYMVECLKESYRVGFQDAVDKCAKLCNDHADLLLWYSQFGSTAAADCAKMIRTEYGKQDT